MFSRCGARRNTYENLIKPEFLQGEINRLADLIKLNFLRGGVCLYSGDNMQALVSALKCGDSMDIKASVRAHRRLCERFFFKS